MKKLHIAILAKLKSPTITKYLVPELQSRGHVVDIIDLSIIPPEDFINHPEVQALAKYDVVYYRSGLVKNAASKSIIDLEAFLKTTSVKTVNLHFTEHPLAHFKSYEAQHAEECGLKIPKSVYSANESFEELNKKINLPFIAKTDLGSSGTGVHRIRTLKGLTEVRERYLDSALLYQEFIPHTFEYRVHTLGENVVCIFKKASPEGDFRTNESQGGEVLIVDQKHVEKLTELTKQTSKAFGFEIIAIDFMLNKNTDEIYFTEINLNPGWAQSDHDVTGVDVISLTADYFEEICK